MDPERRKGVAATATTMIGLPTITIILRCLAVVIVRKSKFAWDDYLAIADLPFIVAGAAITLAMVTFDEQHGAGTWPTGSSGGPPNGTFTGPPSGVPSGIPSGIPTGFPSAGGPPAGVQTGASTGMSFEIPKQMVNMVTAIQFLYLFGLSLPRLSIVCFYYKIFGKTKRWFIWALRAAGAVCVAWLLVNIIVTAVKCVPLKSQFMWTPTSSPGHCINIQAYGISLLASSVVIDLALLILPMPMIFGIKAPLSKRISVALLFMVGSSVIVFTTGRLILTVKGGPFATSSGFMKGGAITAFIQLEAAMSLVSVSLPTIFTLFRHLFSKSKKGVASSSSSTYPLRSDKSGHQHMSDYHRLNRSGHSATASDGRGDSLIKSPLTRSTTILSQSDITSSSVSRSPCDEDDPEKFTLPIMPHQIMVKQEYQIRKDDYA